jgi:hypothetical protein
MPARWALTSSGVALAGHGSPAGAGRPRGRAIHGSGAWSAGSGPARSPTLLRSWMKVLSCESVASSGGGARWPRTASPVTLCIGRASEHTKYPPLCAATGGWQSRLKPAQSWAICGSRLRTVLLGGPGGHRRRRRAGCDRQRIDPGQPHPVRRPAQKPSASTLRVNDAFPACLLLTDRS